jgi:predicted HNH restriction endonuclease
MNRSLNIEKTRSMTAVSQIRSDFSMSNRYEDFFQKSEKSSKTQKVSKLNLIISELKKLKTCSSVKSSFFTRLYKEKERIAQNHSAKNENRKIAKMMRTNFNVQKYTKTKYNRDAIILLFIFSDRDLNLKIFQEIIDVDMRTTKFLYDMMFNTKRANYRKKAKSFLNSFNDCFLEKFVSYFQIFLKKFRRDSSTQEDDFQLNLKRLSKSFFQKNYSIKSLLQSFIKERSIFAFHN